MGALDPEKILMILVVALIVLGPDKLPKVARQLGAGWRELLKFRDKVEREVREAIPDVDLPRIPTSPRAAVAGFLTDLTAPLAAPLPEPDDPEADASGTPPASTPPTGTPSTATPPAGQSTEDRSPVPAVPAPAAKPTFGRPLAVDQPLVAPDDPSMN